MDETYLCPDCMREHAEPQEAVLGHLARCQTCLLMFEALTDERTLHERILEIRAAA